jgi:phage terminase Nu1 subunit (DNA packaging protein)
MIDPLSLKKADLCRALNLSDQTITNYCKAGLPATNGGKGAGARFNLSECIAWIQNHEIKKAVRNSKPTDGEDTEELELRMLRTKVEREEYKTAREIGSVVLIEDADKIITTKLERIRSKLSALPAVWAPQLIGLKEIPDAVDRLDTLTRRLMEECVSDVVEDEDEDEEGSPDNEDE